MNDTVLTALIMATASVVCQLLINLSNRRKREIDEAVKNEQFKAKLSEIDRKLDEHNGYASKFSNLGEAIHRITTDIELIKKDISYLAKGE